MNRALLVVGSLLLSQAALAEAAAGAPWPIALLGRLHPLMVHFPIALLLVMLGLEVYPRVRRQSAPSSQLTAVLATAVLSSVAAVCFGLALATTEEFHGAAARTLDQHRAVGIGVAVCAIAAFAVRRHRRAGHAYLPLLTLAAVGVSVAGHLGGVLGHGADYWRAPFHGDDEPSAPTSVASDGDDPTDKEARVRMRDDEVKVVANGPVDFARDVRPIFQRSCLKCHGAEKRKGGLRLDQQRFAMRGGESGAAIVPKDVKGSLLIKLISLPPDDEDVMPEKGKLLPPSEIALLTRWVEEGAVWDTK